MASQVRCPPLTDIPPGACAAALDPVPHYTGPLLTRPLAESLTRARDAGTGEWTGSLDLGRSTGTATLAADHWQWKGETYAYPGKTKDRTLYYWDGEEFLAISRFGSALIKLVPTDWDAPTFEIDGIKMLPSAQVSPFELDTCGGLGYFAACCLEGGVTRIRSFEKNPDVLWLRTLNPWSPDPDAESSGGRLALSQGDVSQEIEGLETASVDAILHDPPRFGIAGELYSQVFYDQLARVIRKGGRMFHYTGAPNKLTSGRDVPREVAKRLEKAGFKAELVMDGVLAVKR